MGCATAALTDSCMGSAFSVRIAPSATVTFKRSGMTSTEKAVPTATIRPPSGRDHERAVSVLGHFEECLAFLGSERALHDTASRRQACAHSALLRKYVVAGVLTPVCTRRRAYG